MFNKKHKLPTQLELLAIRESWTIHYEKSQQSRISTKRIEPYQMLIKTPRLTKKHCVTALEKWLKRKARRHLVYWVNALCEEFDLDYSSITVRGQRARWGSCSEDRDISLNYKLLFLPAPWVDYILIHELCHTKHLNHSKQFWKCVEKHDADFRKKRREIDKHTQRYLPKWLD